MGVQKWAKIAIFWDGKPAFFFLNLLHPVGMQCSIERGATPTRQAGFGDMVLCVAKTRTPQGVGRATLYSNESRNDELSIEYRVYGVIRWGGGAMRV